MDEPTRCAPPPPGYWWVLFAEARYIAGTPEVPAHRDWANPVLEWNVVKIEADHGEVRGFFYIFDNDMDYNYGYHWDSVYGIPIRVGPQIVEPELP